MTPTHLNTPGPTLQALPVALVFSSQLLLTEKSSVTSKVGSADGKPGTLSIRATMQTTILKETTGYRHYGINE